MRSSSGNGQKHQEWHVIMETDIKACSKTDPNIDATHTNLIFDVEDCDNNNKIKKIYSRTRTILPQFTLFLTVLPCSSTFMK